MPKFLLCNILKLFNLIYSVSLLIGNFHLKVLLNATQMAPQKETLVLHHGPFAPGMTHLKCIHASTNSISNATSLYVEAKAIEQGIEFCLKTICL